MAPRGVRVTTRAFEAWLEQLSAEQIVEFAASFWPRNRDRRGQTGSVIALLESGERREPEKDQAPTRQTTHGGIQSRQGGRFTIAASRGLLIWDGDWS